MPDSIMTGDFAVKPLPIPQLFLTGAQMRALWDAYEAARDAYNESEETEVSPGDLFDAAQQRIQEARTVDPEGIAIKLKVLSERADCPAHLLADMIRDLSQPRLPSLAEFCRAISTAASQLTEEGGGIKSNDGLAHALIPLIGHYTVADAVCAIGLLHTAYRAIGGEDGDDPMFATIMLLEAFASRADAANAESAEARAHLIEKSESGEGWDLGEENLAHATRHAASDMRKIRNGGTFECNVFGGTLADFFTRRGRLGEDLPVAAE